MCCPWALARLLPSAVRVRIRSRSTSASPPRTAVISRPVLVPVSAHGSANDRNCALASTMRLTVLGARPCSLVAVFRLQFGLAFIGPDCRARFDGFLHFGFH